MRDWSSDVALPICGVELLHGGALTRPERIDEGAGIALPRKVGHGRHSCPPCAICADLTATQIRAKHAIASLVSPPVADTGITKRLARGVSRAAKDRARPALRSMALRTLERLSEGSVLTPEYPTSAERRVGKEWGN